MSLTYLSIPGAVTVGDANVDMNGLRSLGVGKKLI